MAELHQKDGFAVLTFDDPPLLNDWLEAHHESIAGIWIKLAKKANPAPSVTYAEALDEALCFGWIDGQKNSYDEGWFLQRFTPRKSRSPWSQLNRDKVEALIAKDRMRPAGYTAIETAKANGQWERAYAGASSIEVPADFQQALDATPAAAEFFATLTGSTRYAFLYRIGQPKLPATRARKIATYVEALARGETLN